MDGRQIFFSFLLVFCYISHDWGTAAQTQDKTANGVAAPPAFKFQTGDPQNCPQTNADFLEILPTYGWDNLRNVPMGSVLVANYSKCRVTLDRKYIIPDTVQVFPVKSSNVESFAELIDHFTNYTSITSKTINVEAHASFLGIGKISGSYSSFHQDIKQHQVDDKTITSRVQQRHVLYTLQSEPSSELHPVFRERLLDIAACLQSDATDHARYFADLLVRDYGTHYVTSVDAGAVIAQEDQLTAKYVYDYRGERSTISASASADFNFHVGFSFGGSASYVHSITEDQVSQYIHNRTYSHIHSLGGPPFRANFTINDWVDNIGNELVELDRAGDPLYFLIEPRTLPELPIQTVQDLTRCVEDAVVRYYRYNVHKGCTDVDKPNFSFIANFDDGTCKSAANNYTFGGVYQTCTGQMCSGSMSHVNPKTGGYSCPDGYSEITMFQGHHQSCTRRCHRCLWWSCHCYDDCIDETYTLYWCAATSSVSKDSGYLFGGVYTSATENPLTNGKSCPAYFTSMRLGAKDMDIFVCISDDYELAFRFSVPFAGFFSCNWGNPLALPGAPKMNAQGLLQTADDSVSQLGSYLRSAGPQAWPKGCPEGYSQHLVAITEGCEINYCVRANALSDLSLPVIRRPPFHIKPQRIVNTTDLLMTRSGQVYAKSTTERKWVPFQEALDVDGFVAGGFAPEELLTSASPSTHHRGKNNSALIAGVTVGVGTAVLGLVILAVVVRKRSARRTSSVYRRIGSHDGTERCDEDTVIAVDAERGGRYDSFAPSGDSTNLITTDETHTEI